ncbi:MAG: GDSL-type esterase/lipase family protein [Bacteroidota bacterium]
MYWYEIDVKHLERERAKVGYAPGLVFYGSSTLKLWNSLVQDLQAWKVYNLGFGGSTLAACVWFFERLVTLEHPIALVIYAGDNDLGDGRHPEEILIFFQQLMIKAKIFGNIPCYFISLKPSPARWHMAEQFRYTNNLIKSEIIREDGNWKFIDLFHSMLDRSGQPIASLYAEDGLHLSKEGYQLWAALIGAVLEHDLKT